MDCQDCRLANQRLWHGYRSDCQGCAARMVSRSPQYFDSKKRGSQTHEYVGILSRLGVTHEAAKAAAGD